MSDMPQLLVGGSFLVYKQNPDGTQEPVKLVVDEYGTVKVTPFYDPIAEPVKDPE